jgi:hypothetical protein
MPPANPPRIDARRTAAAFILGLKYPFGKLEASKF